MNRTALAIVVTSWVTSLPGQDPPAQAIPELGPETPTVAEVIAAVAAREAAARAVYKQVRSRTMLPQGMELRSTAEHRVLVGTHLHLKVSSSFGSGDELTARHELVRTPAGVWVRERDQVQGSVATHMSADLMRRVDAALDAGAGGGRNLGTGRQLGAPLGSALLAQLGEQYALRVDGKVRKDRRAYWKIIGSSAGEPGDSPADGIELLVDDLELSVRELRHFRNGRPVHELVVEELRLDRPEDTDPDSYRIALGEGEEFIDVMEHPPSAAVIRDVLEEAAPPPAEGSDEGTRRRDGDGRRR